MEANEVIAAAVGNMHAALQDIADIMRGRAEALRGDHDGYMKQAEEAGTLNAVAAAHVKAARAKGGADELAAMVKAIDKAVGRRAQ